ncbi:hypothetical protein [Bacillus cytotoxicus]|uniref:hypothetical protein n=1 Tax=Bacillus cytotoxicus TaxID=580165 RepID=UPI000863E7E2|nr:hypothetical protein [Bacillus cytotoxicus]AWC29261.1 hypothetical protein CG483_013625 [Bacillus cytotoxicus]AWC41387.1 hypothetical protein CG480_013625 [Bacillus cytotoxicus]AWC49318.1 hypothetical protein CG478_013625 [Bacillus cytotoxicus]AWC53333.1 hypothetical protein CG477_013585 [Bacillus cytotoxicus]AWC57460.1 hypothetical protein CG476_013610 [Bacillus cytotoxicus]
MDIKQRVKCMDENCGTVVTGHCLDGVSYLHCGEPTSPKPFTAKEIVAPIHIDETEVSEMIKELTNKEEPLLQIVQHNHPIVEEVDASILNVSPDPLNKSNMAI